MKYLVKRKISFLGLPCICSLLLNAEESQTDELITSLRRYIVVKLQNKPGSEINDNAQWLWIKY